MTNEQHDADDARAVIVREQMAVVDVERAMAEWEAYQDLTRRLLTKEDYQKIGNREFKKKSAWRKYARAFNVSCEKVSEEITRGDDGFPLHARIVVRAIDPSGRYQDADQECHISERCCEQARGGKCGNRSQYHEHCPLGCSGRVHFSHPGDIPATAFTRAKNRAISDLIGAGEVSAEEQEVNRGVNRQPPQAKRPPAATAAAAAAQPADDPGPQEPETAARTAGSENGITQPQVRNIRGLLSSRFGSQANNAEAVKWMQEQNPTTVENGNITLGKLTMDQASAIIVALNDEADGERAG